MTYTVLGSDDENYRITVADDLTADISIISLATSSAYTDADARNALSATGDVTYNSASGVISYTQPTTVSTFANDANYATTSDVATAINNLVDGAPSALDTLNEIAAAINDDAAVYTTLNGLISTNATNIAAKLNTADFGLTFDTRLATKDTGDVAEGSNLYFTTARADSNFDTKFATKATTDLTEGTNLYYTDGRFDTRLATKDTDNLAEGSSNLYYTTTRHNTDFDTKLAAADTGDLSEGSNLYYTDTRANSAIDTRVTSAFVEALNITNNGGTY